MHFNQKQMQGMLNTFILSQQYYIQSHATCFNAGITHSYQKY